MSRGPMLQSEDGTAHPDAGRLQPASPSPVQAVPPSRQAADPAGTSSTFEGFLTDVEQCVPDAGQLLLFSGEHLRLEVMLLRHQKNPRVIWGLKRHEDWAFKATLLRFARGSEPVHLVLSTEDQGGYRIRGWVVKRSMDAFWAAPLPADQTSRFWERCLNPFSLKNLEAGPASDGAKPSPQPEPLVES
jgi:hypothetical protein